MRSQCVYSFRHDWIQTRIPVFVYPYKHYPQSYVCLFNFIPLNICRTDVCKPSLVQPNKIFFSFIFMHGSFFLLSAVCHGCGMWFSSSNWNLLSNFWHLKIPTICEVEWRCLLLKNVGLNNFAHSFEVNDTLCPSLYIGHTTYLQSFMKIRSVIKARKRNKQIHFLIYSISKEVRI